MVLLRGEPEALYFTDLYTGLTTARFPESRYAQIAAEAGILDSSYYIYPPWVGVLYAPLTFLSPYRALLVTYVLGWLMTGLALALLAKEIPQKGWAAAAAAGALLIVSTPFGQAIRAGQASIPVLLLVVLFGRGLWRRREVEAGIWLALATGIKLFPVLFVPYLVITRRWRALASFAAAGAALLAFSVAVAGVDAHVRFYHLMQVYMGYSTTLVSNQSITGFLFRLADATSPRVWSVLAIPPGVAWTARVLNLLWFGVVVALVLRARRVPGRWGEILGFSLFSIWAFNSASNVWIHHAVALAIPFTAVAAYYLAGRGDARRSDVLLWGLGWGGIFFLDVINRLGALIDRPSFVLLVSLPLYGTLILFGLIARLVLREAKGELR